MKLYNGDCLIETDKIESGSVDLILCDPPYGNMKNVPSTWNSKDYEWDSVLMPSDIFDIANRVLRKNGKLILFSQEPYTSKLITNAIANVPFSYRMVWEKDNFANALLCNKAPVSYFEDILVFSKQDCYTVRNPLQDIMIEIVNKYGKQHIENLFLNEGRYSSKASVKVHASYKFGYGSGKRFDFIDEKMFNYLTKKLEFQHTYEELKKIDNTFKKRYASTFNLWQGKKYKSNILEYKKDYDGFHPTQKPILLLEDLIKTYSNENNTVLDFTMGSGSTGVACVNTNRKFIGIELNKGYYDIAVERITKPKMRLDI